MSLPVSDLVSVALQVSSMPPTKKTFGTLFVLGASGRLPSESRVATLTGIADAAAIYETTDEEYSAASHYFARANKPKYLKTGQLFTSGAAGHLNTGTCNTAEQLAAIRAVTSGGMDITVDSTLIQLSGLDFSTDDTFVKVASRLQTALAGGVGSTTCTWDGTKFIITSPTLVTGTVSVGSAPTHAGSPTPIQTLLCATVATGALVCGPLATETLTQALENSWIADPTFYGVALSSDLQATAQNVKDMMIWAQAMGLACFYTTNAAECLTWNGTTNLGYYAKANDYEHCLGMYSSVDPDAAIEVAAVYFVVDFDQPNSTTIGKFKPLPGVTPENLTETQRLQLLSYNLNFYTTYGSITMLDPGVTGSGRFFDEIMGLDWLQSTVQSNVLAELAGSVTKIPQTDAGVVKLLSAMSKAGRQGVVNGLLAPGIWTGESLGEVNTGDLLEKGYYIYAQPVAEQSAISRAAREAPAITMICIGAGAIQSCAITITFQR